MEPPLAGPLPVNAHNSGFSNHIHELTLAYFTITILLVDKLVISLFQSDWLESPFYNVFPLLLNNGTG